MVCRFWMKTARFPDLVNLLQCSSDIIEKAGVIKNDKYIESYDGSRIMGKDATNPRVEIEVWIMREEEK